MAFLLILLKIYDIISYKMKKKGKKKRMFPTIKIRFERWKWNTQHEIWVSTEGRLKDRNKEIIEPLLNDKGYIIFFDEVTQKFKNVHRIVLETWRPRADMRDLTVEHKDQNKRNPALRNLMWLTQKENQRRASSNLVYNFESKNTQESIICANGVTMTVEEAVTFLYNSPQCSGDMSKVELRSKVTKLLEGSQAKKSMYGVTFTEVQL